MEYKTHYKEIHLDPKAPIHPYLMLPQKRLSKNKNETKMTSLSQVYILPKTQLYQDLFFFCLLSHTLLSGGPKYLLPQIKSQTLHDLHKLQEKFFIFLSPIRTLVKVCMLNAHHLKT
jgi:hypothetical protein